MTHKKSLVELEQSGQYGSVVIRNCSCTISSTLCSQHFAFEHAPSLPLEGCTANQCTCEYQGIIDRRLGGRRVKNCSNCYKNDNRKSDRRLAPGR
ncbi:MAG: hypothetical protein KZQ70_13940 [gamma proteobacterium symbiont of Lucinoma myriamae]|nr:hypothetical protein [gamma proteobacterium symbiont of Lucinoma myriamae]MCU7833286.1 hypothetical protein [gamma proteobacterium symbiont of Lucinoma myriamae]